MIRTESEDEYLDRICGISKPKKAKKKAKKEENITIFGYDWKDIQAMQMGIYKPKVIK